AKHAAAAAAAAVDPPAIAAASVLCRHRRRRSSSSCGVPPLPRSRRGGRDSGGRGRRLRGHRPRPVERQAAGQAELARELHPPAGPQRRGRAAARPARAIAPAPASRKIG
ncbi:unnamed protein product, partial [Ectocarpus sp. 12 AP-2014]